MILRILPSPAQGKISVPASKSHTIRAIAFGSLASGESIIRNPLDSEDAHSAAAVYEALGANITKQEGEWRVEGFGGLPSPPSRQIDVGNSGTTCRMGLGTAALLPEGEARFDGDPQTRRRPMGPLLDALSDLGARAVSENDDGRLPAKVSGPWLGGETQVDGTTSQYTSSLILNAPFGGGDSIIDPVDLNERPYVDMTLWWLGKLGLSFEREGYEHFCVPGNQALSSFDMEVPADFSSAAFMVAAAALPSGDVLLEGLDMDDPQGDKAILGMVAGMGAEVREENGSIRIRGVSLEGGIFDLNSTPDLLPVMAVLGAFADGETRLVNVPQARIKETDRITAMREVIESLGGSATELPDALIVRGGGLKGGKAHGFGDHRVVMAAAVAGLAAPLGVEVDTAEAMAITFPDFCERMRRLGARMEKE